MSSVRCQLTNRSVTRLSGANSCIVRLLPLPKTENGLKFLDFYGAGVMYLDYSNGFVLESHKSMVLFPNNQTLFDVGDNQN